MNKRYRNLVRRLSFGADESGPSFACAKSFGTETHLDKPKLFGKEPNIALSCEMRLRVADGLRWTSAPYVAGSIDGPAVG